jgi:hypothetical protein
VLCPNEDVEALGVLGEVLEPMLLKQIKEGTMEPALIVDSKDTLLATAPRGDAPTKPTLTS